MEENLLELEKSLSRLKKYYDYDDYECKEIRDVRNLFDLPTDEDFYKPIKTESAFNNNYIENMSPKEYLNMINDHKTQSEWKIQLTMQINFISSKDSQETLTMHTKSHNVEIMIGSKTDEIIEELFEFLLQRYQDGPEESMRGSEFCFDSIDLLYYHLQKTILKRDGSNVDSLEWLKIKQATINPKNNDGDNCFQYALTVALNYQNIKNNPERISKIKPFIDQYNFKEIDFLAHSKDWKKFELNNKKIALNILFIPYNTEKKALHTNENIILSVKTKFC